MTVADSLNIHYLMLVVTYAGTIICRGLITIETWNFAMMLILTLVMESSVTSMSVLVDATVVAGSVKVSCTIPPLFAILLLFLHIQS